MEVEKALNMALDRIIDLEAHHSQTAYVLVNIINALQLAAVDAGRSARALQNAADVFRPKAPPWDLDNPR